MDTEPNLAMVLHMLRRVDYSVLYGAAVALGIEVLPAELPADMTENSHRELLETLHTVMFDVRYTAALRAPLCLSVNVVLCHDSAFDLSSDRGVRSSCFFSIHTLSQDLLLPLCMREICYKSGKAIPSPDPPHRSDAAWGTLRRTMSWQHPDNVT